MGNSSSNGNIGESLSFSCEKIAESANKKVTSIHIDDSLLPNAGVIVVGLEFVENYSENGSKLNSFYTSKFKILCSAINFSNTSSQSYILICCEDNVLYVLDTKSLTIVKKIAVKLYPEDIALQGFEIKSQNSYYFEQISPDFLLAPFDNSVFIGLNTGFICQFSLSEGKNIKTLNPLGHEYKNELKEKVLTLSVENFMIPGIDSIQYAHIGEIIVSNHKNMFTNCFNRTFTLQTTPIYTYKVNGEVHKKFTVDGTVMGGCILENRNFYICLTSQKSTVYVFDLIKGSTVLKFSCDFGKDPEKPLLFTSISCHEFEMNQRNQSANKVIQGQNLNNETINGDLLFFIQDNGSILLSKLTYENDKGSIAWSPLKFMSSRPSDKDVLQNISKTISNLLYNRYKDKLFFTDHQAGVHWLDGVLKLLYATNPNQ